MLFYFLLKTKESASLAWLFLHTGRWHACIESVFYWICGSQIFSLETLLDSWLLSHGFSVYLGNGEHNTRTRSVAVMHSDVM